MKKKIIVISLLLFVCSVTSAAVIYVTKDGDIASAVRTAREMHRLAEVGAQENIDIMLEGNEYVLHQPLYLRQEDSYITLKGNNARISGKVGISSWTKEGKLWVADAPRLDGRPLMIRQLWVNGKKALRSTQFGEYKLERMLDFNKTACSITIPTPQNLKRLQQEPVLEMLVHQRWAIAILRVKSIEQDKMDKDRTVVKFAEPDSYLEFSHPWPQPVIGGEKGNSSFCLQNALCLVDEPGEWYESPEGKIYYYPKADETMKNTDIVAAQTEQLLMIQGTRFGKVKNINIEGINFEYAAWNRPSDFGHVTLQGGFPLIDAYKLEKEGLPWDKDLENQAWIERPVAAVCVEWGENINFNKCYFSHLGATALDLKYAVTDCTIQGSRFEDIGGTAILAGWFGEGTEVHIPYKQRDEEFTSKINIQSNNINDATNEDWGTVGIGLGYVRDCNVNGNRVSRVNYSGICVGWGWTSQDTGMRNNCILGNEVSDFARMLYDAGGIYTLSNQPGSAISNNNIDKLGVAPYATNDRGFYIYLDAKTDGFTIENNWCPEPKFGDNHPGPNIIWK